MIHIACNIDHNYVKHCSVTLVSLFENNPKETFTVHIIARELLEDDRETLTTMAGKYGNEVRYYVPDAEMLEGFTIRATHNRLSLAAYYRCFLSALLPGDIDRVLYLDCDIVVLGSISPLWNTTLDADTGVAVVEDTGCGELQRYERMHYPQHDSYFNSGVMLINLVYWRQHRIAQACVDYYRKYPERIVFNDQDILNCVFHNHKKLVDLKWNVQDGFYRNTPALSDEWRKANAETLKHPIILHYTNRKPWNYDSQHPLRKVYFRYLDLTPWKGERPWNSIPSRLKRFFRFIPFYVGIRKPKYINLKSL